MKEFKLIRIIYLIVIGIFSVLVGFFMTVQVSSESYIPIHGSCNAIEFSTLACVLDETVHFNFKSAFQSQSFVLDVNGKYVGEMGGGVSKRFEMNIFETYEVMPETESGYKCSNKAQLVEHSLIPSC